MPAPQKAIELIGQEPFDLFERGLLARPTAAQPAVVQADTPPAKESTT
jgi:hypothetical protein